MSSKQEIIQKSI